MATCQATTAAPALFAICTRTSRSRPGPSTARPSARCRERATRRAFACSIRLRGVADHGAHLPARRPGLSRPHEPMAGCPDEPIRPVVCGIVPPYLLENIARRGSERQRAAATRSLALDLVHRQARTAGRPTVTVTAPAEDGPRRTVATADGSTTLPGRVVRSEGEPPTGDAATDEAYDGLGATYDLYLSRLRPPLGRRRGPAAAGHRALRPRLRQRVLGRRADGLRRRGRRAVPPVHDRRRRHRPRAHPRRHRGRPPGWSTRASPARSTSRCRTCSARWSSSGCSARTRPTPTG